MKFTDKLEDAINPKVYKVRYKSGIGTHITKCPYTKSFNWQPDVGSHYCLSSCPNRVRDVDTSEPTDSLYVMCKGIILDEMEYNR